MATCLNSLVESLQQNTSLISFLSLSLRSECLWPYFYMSFLLFPLPSMEDLSLNFSTYLPIHCHPSPPRSCNLTPKPPFLTMVPASFFFCADASMPRLHWMAASLYKYLWSTVRFEGEIRLFAACIFSLFHVMFVVEHNRQHIIPSRRAPGLHKYHDWIVVRHLRARDYQGKVQGSLSWQRFQGTGWGESHFEAKM